MVGQLSRSVGSTTASHNRFGAYFRSRVVPVNPDTASQRTQRDSLHDRSQAWRGLTAVQRAGWAALGQQLVRLDSLGVQYNLTGLQAYTSNNRTLVYIGQAVIANAPAIVAVTAVATATPSSSAGGGTLSMAYTVTPVPAGTNYVIEMTRQMSAGISFVPRSLYKKVAVLAAAAASPASVVTAYTGLFGGLVAGQRIFYRLYAVDIASGFKSALLQGSFLVSA